MEGFKQMLQKIKYNNEFLFVFNNINPWSFLLSIVSPTFSPFKFWNESRCPAF